jgi:hypothetical protein
MNRYSGFLFFIALLIAGCDKDSIIPSNSGPDGAYSIETQPALSLDRQYIYYINIDTALPANNGIYRINTATAVREKIIPGDRFSSPTISPDNRTLAYLDSGKIFLYNMIGKTIAPSGIPDTFASITFISDSLIAGHFDSSIYIINIEKKTVTQFFSGWDPVACGWDDFVAIRKASGYFYISRFPFGTNIEDLVLFLGGDTIPSWPSFDTASERLTYTINDDGRKKIYAGVRRGESHLIDSTDFAGSVIVSANKIIFTGHDGRFYVSDFAGQLAVPFVPEIDRP